MHQKSKLKPFAVSGSLWRRWEKLFLALTGALLVIVCQYIYNRSLGALRAPTSIWRQFAPFGRSGRVTHLDARLILPQRHPIIKQNYMPFFVYQRSPQKKIQDYLGIFSNLWEGGPLNPKTSVTLTITLKTPLNNL